jgi:DNA-binding protein HU-beta
MNKAILAEKIASRLNITKQAAADVLEAFSAVAIDALKAGEEVTLSGFGGFIARHRTARMGVNPLNPTERIKMPETRVAKFRAGKTLKDALKLPR